MFKTAILSYGKDILLCLLGVVFGVIVGSVPLQIYHLTDPFDIGASYLVWGIGFFLSALLISLLHSVRVWRWAIFVGVGFPVAVILDMMARPESYGLFPLTIIFSLIVGMIPAFAGAYLGRQIVKNKGVRKFE